MAQFNGARVEWAKVSGIVVREGTYTNRLGRESQWLFLDIVQAGTVVESKLFAPVRRDVIRALNGSLPGMRDSLKAIYATAPEPAAPAAPAPVADPEYQAFLAWKAAQSAPAPAAPTPPAKPAATRKPTAPATPKTAEAELADLPFD